jgi:hypothetical protein
MATPLVAADRPGDPAEIATAAHDCAQAVSVSGINESVLVRGGWTIQTRSTDTGGATWRRAGIDMTLATAALPGANFCAVRARMPESVSFAAVARALGKRFHTNNTLKTLDHLSALRAGEALFDTARHSVTLSARAMDGNPGVQISLLPKR